jgi:hypothetical protein
MVLSSSGNLKPDSAGVKGRGNEEGNTASSSSLFLALSKTLS